MRICQENEVAHHDGAMLCPSTQEPSGGERNSRYSQFAFSDEGFHDDAVPGRRRLSSALAGDFFGVPMYVQCLFCIRFYQKH